MRNRITKVMADTLARATITTTLVARSTRYAG
jgi:hypothetical protein